MVNQTETYVIDPEFAFYGPMGFDIGAIIGNLLLSYASHEVRTADPERRADFRRYLTDSIIGLWKTFHSEFQRTVWAQIDSIKMPESYQQQYMLQVLRDSAGMAGCKMLRRVIGLAGVADIRGIEGVTERSIAASLALNIGQALIMNCNHLDSIESVVTLACASRPT
jgi:5-methylthioribose kinase